VRLSVSTFVYLNFPLDEAIRRIAGFGYDGVEIWGGRPHAYPSDLDAEEIVSLRELSAELGIEVSGFIPAQFRYPTNLCIGNERIRQDSVCYIQDGIEVAASLGAPLVSVCPGHSLYGQDKEDAWERLKESLHTLGGFASERGIRLAIEPADEYETDLVQTSDDALRLLDEVGLDNVGVVLDTGHGHVLGEELGEAIRKLGSTLFHVHVDDNHGQRDEHLIPGSGTIDFSSFLTALADVEYSGFLTVELGFGYTVDPDEAVRESMRRLSGDEL
jgi:protein FrlC